MAMHTAPNLSIHKKACDNLGSAHVLGRQGFVVERAFVEGRLPLPGLRRFLAAGMLPKLNKWAGKTVPGLCGLQMVFVCRKRDC